MGRGIRVGLERCTVCGSATDAGRTCERCELADNATRRESNLRYLASRFGDHFKKNPDLYAAAVEQRYP